MYPCRNMRHNMLKKVFVQVLIYWSWCVISTSWLETRSWWRIRAQTQILQENIFANYAALTVWQNTVFFYFCVLNRDVYCSIHLEQLAILPSFFPINSFFFLFISFSFFFLFLFSSVFLLSLLIFFFSHLYNLKTSPNDLKISLPPPDGRITEQYKSLVLKVLAKKRMLIKSAFL